MIIDLKHFITGEKGYWDELERMLKKMELDPERRMGLEEIKRFQYLYQRASAGLAKVSGLSADAEVRTHLESLVARAYAEVHEVRETGHSFRPLAWLFTAFPRAFRRQGLAFLASLAVTAAGCLFGAGAVVADHGAKGIILPFSHLQVDPQKRVAWEEKHGAEQDRLEGRKTTFSAELMTNNIQVSFLVFALGLTFGIGTVILLFYNGIVLGAVAADYLMAGQGVFLLGWLLPHGVVEIPAVLIGGQAGFVMAGALIGWGRGLPLAARLRKITPDLVSLVFGLAVMLVWAGVVESFLSQYHEPVIPYWAKIAFGLSELAVLILFLALSGRAASRGGHGES